MEGDSSMLNGFGIATMLPSETRTIRDEDDFESIMIIDTASQNIAQVRAQSSTLFLFPDELSSEFSISSKVRVTSALYRRHNLFASRYYRDLNNEERTFQRRIKKRLVPFTRIFSTTLYNMQGQSVLTWDRSRVSGNPNSAFRQWYMPLQVRYCIIEIVKAHNLTLR